MKNILGEIRKKPGELVYLLYFTIVLIRQFFSNTAMQSNITVNNLFTVITIILGTFVIFKIISDWKNYWGCHDIVYAILTVGLLIVANFNLHRAFLWEYTILIMGARRIDLKKILSAYLIVVTPLLISVVAASQFGFIENNVFYRAESDIARYSLGFTYPTDFCSHIFFIVAAYSFIRGKAIKYIEIIISIILAAVCFFVSNGINATICISIIVLLQLLNKFINIDKDNKILTVIALIFMPVMAIGSVVLGLMYDKNNSFLSLVNRLLGGKLENNYLAMNQYSINALGSRFTQKGLLGLGNIDMPNGFFFVESSYIHVLLSAGVLSFIALIIMFTLLIYRQCADKSYANAFILCVVALHSVIEPHIFQLSYNPFFLLVFAGGIIDYIHNDKLEKAFSNFIYKIKLDKSIIRNTISLIMFSLLVEVLAFNMESLVTVFAKEFNSDGYSISIYGTKSDESGSQHSDGICYIAVDEYDKPIENIYLALNLYDIETHKYLSNESYTVGVVSGNNLSEDVQISEAFVVNSANNYSGYHKLKNKSVDGGITLALLFDGEKVFDIYDISVNSSKPFHISYLRVAIIYLLISIIYIFGVAKKNSELSEVTIEVHKVTDDFVSTGSLRTKEHENMRIVYEKKSTIYKLIKRGFDIVMSGIAILLLSPLFLITAIAIKLEDNGPVFFAQNRAGKDLKPFKMWKFRSMYVNADEKLKEMMAGNEQTGHAFKIKNDPRITKVGKFIRRFSIDELPQLFNVFLGDMSIVGPRPILVFQMEECDEYDRQRLIVQPGLTCIWQVSGRANIKWDKWVELDLDYIQKMNVVTDIVLILRTIPVVFTGDGAF